MELSCSQTLAYNFGKKDAQNKNQEGKIELLPWAANRGSILVVKMKQDKWQPQFSFRWSLLRPLKLQKLLLLWELWGTIKKMAAHLLKYGALHVRWVMSP